MNGLIIAAACAATVGWASGAQAVTMFTLTDLGTLGGYLSFGHAINDSGHVTGESSTNAAGETRAFLYDGAGMTDLGTLGVGYSVGRAINDSGQVAGSSANAVGESRAFLYDGAGMTDLGTLGGDGDEYSDGRGINNSGQVVGYSGSSMWGDNRAFLYDGTVMHDLNDLISPDLGWLLNEAWDINDSGQITGRGYDASRQQRAFLLTPVSQPAPVPAPAGLPLLLGWLGMMAMLRLRRSPS